jgi:hypothetical protein
MDQKDGDSMRMTAEPQGGLARRYRLLGNGALVTEISFPAFGPSTAAPIGGQRYRLRRTGVLRDHFTLEADSDGAVVASATQRDPLRREFLVEVGPQRLTLCADSPLRSDYHLLDDQRRIGEIRPHATLRRGAEADLPDSLPLEARAFLMWVVLLLWSGRRVTRAAAGL